MAGSVQKIASKLKGLDHCDPFRIKSTTELLEKLYARERKRERGREGGKET